MAVLVGPVVLAHVTRGYELRSCVSSRKSLAIRVLEPAVICPVTAGLASPLLLLLLLLLVAVFPRGHVVVLLDRKET